MISRGGGGGGGSSRNLRIKFATLRLKSRTLLCHPAHFRSFQTATISSLEGKVAQLSDESEQANVRYVKLLQERVCASRICTLLAIVGGTLLRAPLKSSTCMDLVL